MRNAAATTYHLSGLTGSPFESVSTLDYRPAFLAETILRSLLANRYRPLSGHHASDSLNRKQTGFGLVMPWLIMTFQKLDMTNVSS
jgi:hypothetical protein